MGLCKCPKKKVTNQFCFEHNVKVCEHCMTTGQHKTCIVGDYLQWIDNSSYDPNCFICKTLLSSFPCVRLCCFHIFHLECLNNYASQLPPNTAPAGYACPICSKPIFSFNQTSTKSVILSSLEEKLSSYSWAREGLMDFSSTTNNSNNSDSNRHNGQLSSSFHSNDSTKINMLYNSNNSKPTPKILHSLHNKHMSTPLNVNNVTSFISTNSDLSFGSTSSMRSKFDNESRRSLLVNVDEIAEDKYQSKSPIEFIFRWLRSRSTYIRNHSKMSNLGTYKKFIFLGICAFIMLFVFIHLILEYGRNSADNDPLLDPKFDPMIKSESN